MRPIDRAIDGGVAAAEPDGGRVLASHQRGHEVDDAEEAWDVVSHPMATRGIHAICLFAWLGTAGLAKADDTIRLAYEDATGDCPSEEELRSELAARVGEDRVDSRSDREVAVSIVRAHPRELVAQIVVSEGGEPTGQRELRHTGRRCAELTEDLLLTLTLILDTPPARPSPPEPAPAVMHEQAVVAPPVDPEPRAAPESEREAEPEAPREDPTSIRVDLLGGVGFGALPNVAWVVEANVGVSLGAWVVAIGARYTGSPEEPFAPGGVRAALARARVFGGYAFRGLELGVVLAAGALVASGHGFTENARVARASLGVGPRLSWTWRASPSFGLRLFGELMFALVSTDVRVDTDRVWAAGPLAGALGAGVVWGR